MDPDGTLRIRSELEDWDAVDTVKKKPEDAGGIGGGLAAWGRWAAG